MKLRQLACLAVAALVALVLASACSSAPPAPAGPRVQDGPLRIGSPAIAGVDGPIGVTALDTPAQPWVGNPPIVRTTADIMAEAARTPAVSLDLNRPRFQKIRPDRRYLPQHPDALPGSVALAFDRGPSPSVAHTVSAPTADVATLADTSSLPPDTMGDVGPTQYLAGVNGRIRTISKITGVADGVLDVAIDTFFSSVRNGAGTSDPRVRYDRRTSRWFVIIINVALPNRNLVAVSNGATITSSTQWTFFQWTNTRTQGGVGGAASCLGDYPTLGLDEDALYIGVNQFCGAGLTSVDFDSTSLYVLRKSALTGGTLSVAQFDGVLPTSTSSGIYTPQGVDNFDANTNEGYFIGVDNTSFGRLIVRRVANPAAAPSLSSDILVNVPPTGFPIDVPHQGGVAPLDGLDDRLLQAVIRNGRLWTAHQMQIDASGAASGSGGRNGARWYELGNLGATPSVVQSGTVFDSATTTPLSFFMGAIMVNGQGHAALGMTRAGAAARVNTAVTGRLASDPAGAMDAPVAFSNNTSFAYNVQTGVADQRWGDYSYTSVDPDDDQTLWTLQQYVNANNSYAVRLTRLLAPPPAAITALSPLNVAPGQTAAVVTVTGAATGGRGFFDPGASFPRRLAASFSGTGVTVTNVVVNSPTSLTLTLNTVGAPLGARTVTVTNPDGQMSSLAGALVIGENQPPAFGTVPADRTLFVVGGGGSTGPIAFTVSDPEGAPVNMTATSSNPAVIPAPGIVLGGTGINRSVTITSSGVLGASTITLTASDGAVTPLTATTSFVVTVSPSVSSSAPQNLTATVIRNLVVFSWQAPLSAASEPVSGYRLEAGFGPGSTAGTLALGNVLAYSLTAPSGVFFVRLRAQTAAGVGPPSNEVQVTTGEAAPPLAPRALLATVQGTLVSMQWTENPQGPVIVGYQLQAGTAAGLANLGVLPLPATARTFSVNAAPGTYFLRVVAVNAAGAGTASNETVVVPGPGTCTVPAAPAGLVAGSTPSVLSVRWDAAQTGAIPTSYLLQAGSVSGVSNLGSVSFSGTTTAAAGTVPVGPYFLRVFAVNACGTSPASAEASAVVP